MRYYTVISIVYIYIYKQYLLPYNTSFEHVTVAFPAEVFRNGPNYVAHPLISYKKRLKTRVPRDVLRCCIHYTILDCVT